MCLCVRLSERDEHDARHQYSLRPHEGQPAVLDPKSLPVQRWHNVSDVSPSVWNDKFSRLTAVIWTGDVLFPAKVACVKSRDMHWALVAHRDQRDVNLSSLRMLVVADGSNPCKLTVFLIYV